MEQFLQAALREGEYVIWQGTPDPYRLLDADNKKATLTTWIISIAIAAGLSVLYTMYALSGDGSSLQPFVYILTIGFPFIGFIDPYRDKRHINAQKMAITDQRVLVFHKSTASENNALEMRLESIDAIRVEEIEPGYSRICIGSPAFGLKHSKKRRCAILGVKDDDKITALILYRMANSDCAKICSMFQERGVTMDKGQ